MAIYSAVFKQPRQHSRHPSNIRRIFLIRRHIQRETEIMFHTVNRSQKLRKLFFIYHVSQNCPCLGVQIDFTAFTCSGTNVFLLTECPHIPFTIPGFLINTLSHGIIFFFQKFCIISLPDFFHKQLQFSESKTELMRKHDGFRFRIGCDIQRIIPVCKINPTQPISSLIPDKTVCGCF